jgi:hypothetical protein
MSKNERWEAGRDNKYFEGEQGKEKKRRGNCPQFRGCMDYGPPHSKKACVEL